MLKNVLNGEQAHFIAFWKMCCKMEGYFSFYPQTSAPSSPSRTPTPTPSSSKGKKRAVDTEDEEDGSPQSSVKRRRQSKGKEPSTDDYDDEYDEDESPRSSVKRRREIRLVPHDIKVVVS